MVEVAARAAIVMYVIGAVNIATGAFVGINTVHPLSAGTGGIAVIVDVTVEDLVVAGPDGDSAVGRIFDFKPVNDVVAAVDIEADVAIGSVLSINNSATRNFRFECNGTGSGTAFAKMDSPTAVVVGVNSGLHNDDGAGSGPAVSADNGAQWLGGCPRIRVIT